MSEYTPTWRDLREGFARWHETDDYGYPGIPAEESKAAADRWLAAEKAKWQAEAWDEGYSTGLDYMSQWLDGDEDEPENPYEIEED